MSQTSVVTAGSTISLIYVLSVNDEIVDAATIDDPFVFVQGEGQVIAGLDDQVLGLSVGDKRSLKILPEDAYGPHNPSACQAMAKSAFENPDNLQLGDVVSCDLDDGEYQATVVEIDEQTVTLDFNHPLAGKILQFDIEVLKIEA